VKKEPPNIGLNKKKSEPVMAFIMQDALRGLFVSDELIMLSSDFISFLCAGFTKSVVYL
jgi:hypothetical protein